jgi:transposase-like protein
MDHCPRCTSDDLLRIDLAPRGREMHFNTCRACEHKWWVDVKVSVEISLHDVLQELAAA